MGRPAHVGYSAPGRQRPHEIVICFSAILSGLFGFMAPGSVSPSIAQAFPGVLSDVYFASLILAGVVTLYGAYTSRMISPMMERAGLFMMALFIFAYALSLISRNGQQAYIAVIMPVAVSIANMIRVWQITQALKDARHDLE